MNCQFEVQESNMNFTEEVQWGNQKQHFDNQIAATTENPGWSHNVRVGDESIDANSMTNNFFKRKKRKKGVTQYYIESH